jgi:hypothetical protein
MTSMKKGNLKMTRMNLMIKSTRCPLMSKIKIKRRKVTPRIRDTTFYTIRGSNFLNSMIRSMKKKRKTRMKILERCALSSTA